MNTQCLSEHSKNMRIRNFFPLFQDEGEIVAGFGSAKLVKYLNGKYELRGGSKDDRLAAHEWVSLFCHDVVINQNSCATGR